MCARTPSLISANQGLWHSFSKLFLVTNAREFFWKDLLAKDSTAVSTATLAHCQAAENANGEEQDGTQHTQAGKIVFQNTNLKQGTQTWC